MIIQIAVTLTQNLDPTTDPKFEDQFFLIDDIGYDGVIVAEEDLEEECDRSGVQLPYVSCFTVADEKVGSDLAVQGRRDVTRLRERVDLQRQKATISSPMAQRSAWTSLMRRNETSGRQMPLDSRRVSCRMRNSSTSESVPRPSNRMHPVLYHTSASRQRHMYTFVLARRQRKAGSAHPYNFSRSTPSLNTGTCPLICIYRLLYKSRFWFSPGIGHKVILEHIGGGEKELLSTTDKEANHADASYTVMIPPSTDPQMSKFHKDKVACLPFRVSFDCSRYNTRLPIADQDCSIQ